MTFSNSLLTFFDRFWPFYQMFTGFLSSSFSCLIQIQESRFFARLSFYSPLPPKMLVVGYFINYFPKFSYCTSTFKIFSTIIPFFSALHEGHQGSCPSSPWSRTPACDEGSYIFLFDTATHQNVLLLFFASLLQCSYRISARFHWSADRKQWLDVSYPIFH